MASLTRKQIRDDAVARLLAYGAIASAVGTRVYPSRTIPLGDANIPALCVYTSSESSAYRGPGTYNPVFERRLEIGVNAYVTAVTDALLENQTDISDTIQRALIADPNWIALFERVESVDVSIIPDADSDRRRCVVRVVFTVRYHFDHNEA